MNSGSEHRPLKGKCRKGIWRRCRIECSPATAGPTLCLIVTRLVDRSTDHQESPVHRTPPGVISFRNSQNITEVRCLVCKTLHLALQWTREDPLAPPFLIMSSTNQISYNVETLFQPINIAVSQYLSTAQSIAFSWLIWARQGKALESQSVDHLCICHDDLLNAQEKCSQCSQKDTILLQRQDSKVCKGRWEGVGSCRQLV